MKWVDVGKYILFIILGVFFIKDFFVMPYLIGEARTKKDYWKTIRIGIIIIALIFVYSIVMGLLF